jgi:hypothetical protein
LAAADLRGGGSRPLLVRSTPIPQKVVGREAPGLSGVKRKGWHWTPGARRFPQKSNTGCSREREVEVRHPFAGTSLAVLEDF